VVGTLWNINAGNKEEEKNGNNKSRKANSSKNIRNSSPTTKQKAS
jgi:hypothetical protein